MPTSKPLLHSLTESKLNALQANPPHALLLSGPSGVGKRTVALWFVAGLLNAVPEKLHAHPYFLEITSVDGKAIGIEAVRQIEHIMSLKAASKQATNRVILITDAHLLSGEAQNALLKTLEEPPQGTVIILTSSEQQALLPTIQSRLQSVEITPPTREALEAALAESGVSSAKATSIFALSGGLPGLAFALSKDDQEHPLVVAAQTARQLLQQSSFEKLCQVDALAKNREASRNLIHMLLQMAHAALLTGRGSQRWQKVQQAAYDADKALTRGTQPKLVLTNLMLSL